MKNLTVLGSTGSIGTQALNVAKDAGYNIFALTANKNIDLLYEQIHTFNPKLVCVADKKLAEELKARLTHLPVKVLGGEEGLSEVAAQKADLVLNALVGIVGLKPTVACLKAKNKLALANKESLVAGGQLVMDLAKENNIEIIPVDSELSAIFQCLQDKDSAKSLTKILLTASGGPFFGKSREELSYVTAKDALNHPNWDMGAKVTIDSATLMNKGLELTEATFLFNLPVEDVEILVHRQSIVHSLVQFCDYSILGQLSVTDMQIPIQYALTYPERKVCPSKELSLTDIHTLTFEKPDTQTFTCLKAAIEALKMGGLAPCIVNGANEMCVKLFLEGKIKFLDIGRLVLAALESIQNKKIYNLDDVFTFDKLAKDFVLQNI